MIVTTRLGRAVALVATTTLVWSGLVSVLPSQAAPPTPPAGPAASEPAAAVDVHREPTLPKSLTDADRAAFRKAAGQLPPAPGRRLRSQGQAPPTGTGGVPVGGTKNWLLLDETQGGYEPATYTLRGLGSHIEVWVANDLEFPTGDCRNDGVRDVVTDGQVNGLIGEFDNNILPKESKLFSVAPDRDGSASEFAADLGDSPTYYTGDGAKTVVLVQNVRDANFYDQTTPEGATRIAGFFDPLLNQGFDRNVMTIDSFDWLHNTGANPPNDGPGGACSSTGPGSPRDYEATFAHEYQHLLESYIDPDENTWLNEGLSDFAQTAVGYVDTRIPFPKVGYDSHIACFQGFAVAKLKGLCGAENSVTEWGDQGDPSILADYGAAYAYVTYLRDHYGEGIVTYLHRSLRNGLNSVNSYTRGHDPRQSAAKSLQDFAAQNVLDRLIDSGAAGLSRTAEKRFTSRRLSTAVNFDIPESYASPGAPPNGADYVLARGPKPLTAKTLTKISFTGSAAYAPVPLEWKVADGALYAGTGDNLDRSAVYSVQVPSGSPTLTFDSRWDIEQGWDFGVVQVSTDGGLTYRSLGNGDTTADHDPDAQANITRELPGFSGLASTYRTESFDLSSYAGQKILLSFRYLTDSAFNGNTDDADASGWWVKNVLVGSTLVTAGTTLTGARTATQIRPVPVAGWNLQVIGWTTDGKHVVRIHPALTKGSVTLKGQSLAKALGKSNRVALVVTVDDPQEVAPAYAPYSLKLNGTRVGG